MKTYLEQYNDLIRSGGVIVTGVEDPKHTITEQTAEERISALEAENKLLTAGTENLWTEATE